MARRKSRSTARKGAFVGAAAAALLAFPGAASAAVTSSVTNGDLVVTSDAGDAIAITSVGGQVKVNGANPGNGPAASATIDSIVVTGDSGANNIDLSGVNATDFTTLASVTVDGAGGNDTINGSQLADTLRGGDGNDINDGGDGNDTTRVNGADAFGEQFTVKPSTLGGFVRFDRTTNPPGPFGIEISGSTETLDLNANGGDDTVTADPGFSTLRMDVDGGEGNDNLDGGEAAGRLSGDNGNDRLVGDNNPGGTRDESFGGGGDDTMVWNPGDGDDINEGGDGNDTTEVNGGGGGEQFEGGPSAPPGRVAFDRTGPSPTPGPFNIDIGTTENLRLNAGGGNDKIEGKKGLAGLLASTLNGDDGNDQVKGTDGEDLLSGGKGNDLIRSR